MNTRKIEILNRKIAFLEKKGIPLKSIISNPKQYKNIEKVVDYIISLMIISNDNLKLNKILLNKLKLEKFKNINEKESYRIIVVDYLSKEEYDFINNQKENIKND